MSHDISAEATGDRNQLAVPPSKRDHRQGSLNAKVVLVEYGDYQCFQSGELYALIQTIQKQLNAPFPEQNNLCFIFRHFPQPQIHPQAQKAAAASEAAAAQGQFWQMHEILLKHQQNLGDGYLAEYAHNLGLDITQFVRDIARKVYVDRINEDIESGNLSGVTAAPALFINGICYHNRWNIEQLMAAIVAASD
jgi:protein-disulfide isomerase